MRIRFFTFLFWIYPALVLAQPPSYKPMIDSSAACSPTRGYFFIVEEMPSIIQPLHELEYSLNQKVSLMDEERNIDGELYIQCMVNCEGDPGDYQLTKCPDELSGAGSRIIEVFRNETIKWKPGKQGGMKVDVFMILQIKVKNGMIEMIVLNKP